MSKQSMNGQQTIPCAKCGSAPALRDCAVKVSALGLGEIMVYLCRKDYEAVIAQQRAEATFLATAQQEEARFQHMRQEVASRGVQLHGGQWPPRETLWKQLDNTEKQYNEARIAYRQANNSTDEGKRARLRVLRLAGLG